MPCAAGGQGICETHAPAPPHIREEGSRQTHISTPFLPAPLGTSLMLLPTAWGRCLQQACRRPPRPASVSIGWILHLFSQTTFRTLYLDWSGADRLLAVTRDISPVTDREHTTIYVPHPPNQVQCRPSPGICRQIYASTRHPSRRQVLRATPACFIIYTGDLHSLQPPGSPREAQATLTVQLHLLRAVVVDHGQERCPVAAIPHQVLQQREVGRLPRGQVLSAVAHLREREDLVTARRRRSASIHGSWLDHGQNNSSHAGKPHSLGYTLCLEHASRPTAGNHGELLRTPGPSHSEG